jgi:hypothetical protein
VELRCPSKLHGVVSDDLIEVKCGSTFCGAGKGVTVLHRFNPSTGDLVETLRFKDPRKETQHAAHNGPAARAS